MSSFAERLRQVMFDKRCKAIDVSRGTKIAPSVISRYLSGTNKPSGDNIFAIANYFGVSPEWLLNSSDRPELTQRGQGISIETEQLFKIIEIQGELIDNLHKQIKEWEAWKAGSRTRHAKKKSNNDNAIKKNKKKVGFLKKHKSKI